MLFLESNLTTEEYFYFRFENETLPIHPFDVYSLEPNPVWYNETAEPLFTTEEEVEYSTTITTTTSYKSTNPVTPERSEKTLIPTYDVYVNNTNL